jgi:hypothetical protein
MAVSSQGCLTGTSRKTSSSCVFVCSRSRQAAWTGRSCRSIDRPVLDRSTPGPSGLARHREAGRETIDRRVTRGLQLGSSLLSVLRVVMHTSRSYSYECTSRFIPWRSKSAYGRPLIQSMQQPKHGHCSSCSSVFLLPVCPPPRRVVRTGLRRWPSRRTAAATIDHDAASRKYEPWAGRRYGSPLDFRRRPRSSTW